jgi:hypothetical protein
MLVRVLLPLVLLAVLVIAASCSDEDGAVPLSPEQMARFDYGVRLSLACRRSTYRLGEALPGRGADPLTSARAWRAEAIRLDRELRAERFEDFLRVRAGDLHAASGSLKGALGALTRALRAGGAERRDGVRESAAIVRASGERLRVVGRSLGAAACERVDAAPERQVLPGIERSATGS